MTSRARFALVSAMAGAVIVVCVWLALSMGHLGLTGADLLDVMRGTADTRQAFVYNERVPRALAAVVFGACLGVSGALFQSLTSNALGSPDVIGLNSGAYTGVIVVLMIGGTGYAALAAGAVVGSLVAALAVFVLAYRQGLAGYRMIIVGIAISAILSSFNNWFSVRADLDESVRAAIWGAGTLHGIEWTPLRVVTGIAAVTAVSLPFLAFAMRALDLGEDTAAALGVGVERVKLAMALVGVVFTAVVTAVAGPIAFVSLAAPQIARRLLGRPSSSLVGSALVGAAVLSIGDLTAQRFLGDVHPPVGAVTVTLGGLYLVWLLLRETGK